MKKILGFALALIIVASSFASCVRNNPTVEDNAMESHNATNSVTNQDSSLSSDKATDKATDDATEKATDNNTDDTAKEDNKDDNKEDNKDDVNNEDNKDNEDKTPVTTVAPTLNINGTVKEWDLAEGISETFQTAASLANTKFEVNIPVAEAGSYKLNFNTSLGFTKTFSSGGKKATLSLPKTVFKEGEPIPVAYSTSGLSTANNNSPRLCISKNIGGVDKYICWEYVQKNSSGIVDASIMQGLRQDDSLLNYVWLPAGEYKIYFIDESYDHLQNPSYWLHDEPINISIVPENSVGTTVTRSGSTYGSASVSVANNIFCQGANIALTYTANNLVNQSGSSDAEPWLAISKTIQENTGFFDYYTHWDYTGTTETGNKAFNASNGNSAQTQVSGYKSLPVGSYKIYYVCGSNLQTGLEYVEPIGINIAPAASLSAKLDSTSLLSTNSPYDISDVSNTVSVTDADVEKGYITVSFSFGSLSANTTYFLNVQNVSLVKQ